MKQETIQYICDLCGVELDGSLIVNDDKISHDAGWAEILVPLRNDDDYEPDMERDPVRKHICDLCVQKIRQDMKWGQAINRKKKK